MLLRGANAVGYTTYADNVVNAFVKESVRLAVLIWCYFMAAYPAGNTARMSASCDRTAQKMY